MSKFQALVHRMPLWRFLWGTILLFGSTAPIPASSFTFGWELVEDNSAIYWPQRRQPAPESLLQVSLDEARANVQVLFSAETLNDFKLLAADEAGSLYAQARLASQVTHLVRSRDGGKTWQSVRSDVAQEFTFRLRPDPVDILSLAFDPRDPEVVHIGTTAGWYLNRQQLIHPPSTLHVTALALHPQNSDLLFMASRPFSVEIPATLSGRGLYRRRLADGKVTWDDLSPNLPGQVAEIGFDLLDKSRLYIRTEEGLIYTQAVPEQFRPEDFGWETVPAMPPKAVAEDQKTAVARLLRVSPEYTRPFINSPLEVHGGLLYGQNRSATTGMRSIGLGRSRTGGFSWEYPGSVSGVDDDLLSRRLKALYNGWNQVLFLGDGLPGIASDLLGPSAYDPLDPGTLYVAQRGRGLLYRSQDLQAWEELSQGLDPMLLINEVAVDSSAAIYVRSGSLILRKQGTPRPIQLTEARLWPDTVSAGSSFTLSARPVVQTDYRGSFALSAEVNGQRYPLADRGDGLYEAQIQIGQEPSIGFDGATLVLEVPGQPLARVSQYLPFMVVPPEHVTIYGDGVVPDWKFQLVDGNMDLAAANPYTGTTALQLEGRMICQYSGKPIHPFGYVLEFYVVAADTSAITGLTVNEQAVVGLALLQQAEGNWTRIQIPAERLNIQPKLIQDGSGFFYWVPAYITELRFRSLRPLYFDDIRLVTVRPSVLPPTLVAETRDAVLPQAFRLDPNYPNPFNSSTIIRFALPGSIQTELSLYNLAGQKVVTLLSGPREAGIYTVQWDGRDDQGHSLSTGVYLYRLQAGTQVETRKLLLLR